MMDGIKDLLNRIISNESLIFGVLSNLKVKNNESYSKVDIKPVLIQGEIKIQLIYNYKNKVLHDNLDSIEAINKISQLLDDEFRQGVFFTIDADYQVLISKKGKINLLKNKPSKEKVDLSHNRKKQYILEENEPVDFLVRLGVMNEKGKVVAKRYDKFKQINRFLEMVSDTISILNKDETINIIDFGCGKSYLTFALYYYLVKIQDFNVNIIGLDLKEDVIKFCNSVAEELNYHNLKFIYGDIEHFQEIENIDMMVTLHACDTATDAALIKAMNWNTKIILSVPCCQHELYDKVKNIDLNPMLKHGIIKEKLSSLVTDSIRANILEILGYQVQLLEFIDMEHTPKNILIRAIKISDVINKDAVESYKRFKEMFNLKNLYIEKELGDEFLKIIK